VLLNIIMLLYFLRNNGNNLGALLSVRKLLRRLGAILPSHIPFAASTFARSILHTSVAVVNLVLACTYTTARQAIVVLPTYYAIVRPVPANIIASATTGLIF
jgi:hypothetical protein